jgi:hypothetical protein
MEEAMKHLELAPLGRKAFKLLKMEYHSYKENKEAERIKELRKDYLKASE